MCLPTDSSEAETRINNFGTPLRIRGGENTPGNKPGNTKGTSQNVDMETPYEYAGTSFHT